jgi:hypothetical protein
MAMNSTGSDPTGQSRHDAGGAAFAIPQSG